MRGQGIRTRTRNYPEHWAYAILEKKEIFTLLFFFFLLLRLVKLESLKFLMAYENIFHFS